MRRIPYADWDRTEVSDFFGSLDWPFYSVTFRTDAAGAYRFAKENGVSVYLACVYAVMRALNATEAFLYKLRPDAAVRHDFLSPSFTVADGERFKIVSVNWNPAESALAFCRRAQAQTDAQTRLFPSEAQEARDDFAYLSCVPWLDFTSLTNERSLDKNDSVPRVSWGKFTKTPDGRVEMPVSVDVNHRLIDGRHLGQFQSALSEAFAAF